MSKFMKALLPLAFAALPFNQASAQVQVTTSTTVKVIRPERPMLWGGLSSELYVLPGVSLGISAPLTNQPNFSVSLRGTVDAILIPIPDIGLPLPIPLINADLLFSSVKPGSNVYGGPSVATITGDQWLAGGVLGVRNDLSGNWGWYAEMKARALVFSNGQAALIGPSLGARIGFTRRF